MFVLGMGFRSLSQLIMELHRGPFLARSVYRLYKWFINCTWTLSNWLLRWQEHPAEPLHKTLRINQSAKIIHVRMKDNPERTDH